MPGGLPLFWNDCANSVDALAIALATVAMGIPAIMTAATVPAGTAWMGRFHGNASVICCAIHSAVGYAVTLIQTSSRRASRTMTRIYSKLAKRTLGSASDYVRDVRAEAKDELAAEVRKLWAIVTELQTTLKAFDRIEHASKAKAEPLDLPTLPRSRGLN